MFSAPALAKPEIARPVKLALPGGEGGIGFDDSHCVAVDDVGHAYVCDPKQGALLVVTDPFPAAR